MSWVLVKWHPRDGDSRMPRFRNMYDILTAKEWDAFRNRKESVKWGEKWDVVATTDTEAEAQALQNLMPKYNDDIQTS